MTRTVVWLQLVIGWLPIWALYTMMMVSVHGTPLGWSAWVALRSVACAALLGLLVQRFTNRMPWPRGGLRAGFFATHLAGAALYTTAWVLLSSAVEVAASMHRHQVRILEAQFIVPFLILGVWLYVMVAGVSYAQSATERAARAEALAARSQLAALRAQLNPHFLFNALHTVVQLIPRRPAEAAQTAERLAGLLRTTIEEDRDQVTLADEWAFVSRYLELERVRFGERLVVRGDIGADAQDALVPSFALQTLVENAVRHAATPRVEPTTISVRARVSSGVLTVSVADDGAGTQPGSTAGTGLRRLRERLAALYGARATLETGNGTHGGFTATLAVPQESAA